MNRGAAGYDLLVSATDTGIATKLEAALVSTFARTLIDNISAAAMRTTLGRGGGATANVGTTAGTVVAGNDPGILGVGRSDAGPLLTTVEKARPRGNIDVGSVATRRLRSACARSSTPMAGSLRPTPSSW